MVKKQFVVIAYDLPNDKRRLKLSELLEEFGRRMNYSVFECLLTKNEFKDLKKKIDNLINHRMDQVLIYEICNSCVEKIDRIGNYQSDYKSIEKI